MSELEDTTQTRAERIAESVRTQFDETTNSRRSFLARSAVAGGALVALTSGLGSAQDEEEDEPEELTQAFDNIQGTDLDVLNYALTLEHLQVAFYEDVLDEFGEDDFVEADVLAEFDEELRQEAYDYMETISEQQSIHATVLSDAVSLLNGTPEQPAEYDFGIETVADVVELGQIIQNTAVAAYAGAAPFVESPDLLSAALGIHSVEARHAALFNRLNDDSPFPDAIDEAMSQDDVLDTVSPFIVGEEPEEDEEEEEEEEEEDEEDDDEEEDEDDEEEDE